MPLFYALLATTVISLLSLGGLTTLSLQHKKLQKIVLLLVALSAGTLMGTVFFHLLPEATEVLPPRTLYGTVLLSFILFFLVEKVLHWRHCHRHDCESHSIGYINLLGDGLHNFTDGLIIFAAFATDTSLGIVTTIAIASHEIPQEIGDFGVLLHAGFSRKKALLFNLASAATAILGALVGALLMESIADATRYLLPLAAGGFLYIAASDLLPELRKETHPTKLMLSFLIFLLGIILTIAITFLAPEHGHAHEEPHTEIHSERVEDHHYDSAGTEHEDENDHQDVR